MIQHCDLCATKPLSERSPAERFQDSKYGQDMRVHNPRKVDGKSTAKPRCTICGE